MDSRFSPTFIPSAYQSPTDAVTFSLLRSAIICHSKPAVPVTAPQTAAIDMAVFRRPDNLPTDSPPSPELVWLIPPSLVFPMPQIAYAVVDILFQQPDALLSFVHLLSHFYDFCLHLRLVSQVVV